jgi:hypothetical protein
MSVSFCNQRFYSTSVLAKKMFVEIPKIRNREEMNEMFLDLNKLFGITEISQRFLGS